MKDKGMEALALNNNSFMDVDLIDLLQKSENTFIHETQGNPAETTKEIITNRASEDSGWFVEWIEDSLTLDSYLKKSRTSSFHDPGESVTVEETCESSEDYCDDSDNYDPSEVHSEERGFNEENSFTEEDFEENEGLDEKPVDTTSEEQHENCLVELNSDSLEKIIGSFDESTTNRENKVSEMISCVTSSERRQDEYESLVLQYDQMRRDFLTGASESARSLNTVVRCNTFAHKKEAAVHHESQYVISRTQSRACKRLYDLAKKKHESESKSRIDQIQSCAKVASRSTKSISHRMNQKQSNGSLPVFERLYSLAPKRTRKVEMRQELRWR